MINRPPLIIALSVACLFAVSSSRGAKVDPPIPASIRTTDGVEHRGQITDFDDTGITLTEKNTPQRYEWTAIQPPAVLLFNERLLGANGTAAQWLNVGKQLFATPAGKALADRAFARALRIDPTLGGEIERIKHDASAPSTQPTTTTADAGGAAAYWGKQTDEQMNAAVAELKQRVQGMMEQSHNRLTPYETKYFLFYSNLPQSEAMKWSGVLDQMYARLANLFAIPKGENLWRGKCVIIVFGERETFDRFEKDVFNIDKPAGGRCHAQGDGNVFITFFRAPSDLDFAHTLVHETTHGFLFRYRSPVWIPSWANEGLAEVMAFELVPHAGLKQSSDAEARAELRRADAFKNFFESDHIEFFQYPIARSLSEFMIRQNKKGYVDFINAIKDGTSADEALATKYGVGRDVLVAAYKQSMGVK